ncbi:MULTISPECIES: ABC transporter substrate-binding protein [unclassified Paenibacillus]|uniref:ABC transporter substrate-binding protein n=1 Tax=unclassified Paenibacillus TaxID=185978 RepID=UPI000CFB8BAC|nr:MULTISPECIES: ABC transporter substrate-binding protein [unclassified Paenibacillus]PRA09660.1 ABC transporter substrate-binding protein [Paenibacillus sp. MYb63]PRA46415.1 ABC transporter substrate-binding protein [Paenibacillus sp. MYb67]QZN73885.1 SgrR family transcriptional regulator [Paenibacillus sp. DR312]
MKLHQQYLLLHRHYGHHTEHELTLANLAELLNCTHRNTLTIVKKMVAHDWIRWVSQRGRGRRSSLTLLVPADQIAAEYMMEAMNRRELQEAAEQVSAFSSSTTMQDHLNQWLLGYSGHHTEAGTNNEQIDTLRLPLRQQLHALDPLYINLLAESFVTSHVFDGLVQRGEKGEILPCLAHTWDVSVDRQTWTFYIRKGITFHNGQMLTSHDIVHTFERLQSTDRRTLYRDVSKQILSIEAVSPLTVCFRLKKPHELFLSFLTTSRAAIVPSPGTHELKMNHAGDLHGMQKPVGTGPFKVTAWDDHLCRLEAFSSYFQGRAHMDRVDILQIPWSASAKMDDSQDIDTPFFHLVHNPSSSTGADWTQISAGVMVHKLLTCNTQKAGPLNDPAVRAHIQSCLAEMYKDDRHADESKVVVPDFSKASTQMVQVHSEGCNHISQRLTATARAVSLHIATIPQYRRDAQHLASILEQCGYSCTVRTGTMEQFKGDLRLESDLILFSLIRDRDEELRRYDLYSTLSEHLEDSARITIHEMLQTIIASPIAADRTSELDRIEQFLVDQNLLFHLSKKPVETAYLPSVRGLSFNSQGWVNLRHIWFP